MKNVLYLHGFASSPRGRKIALLRERLEPHGFRIIAPDLNVPSFQRLDFKAMTRMAVWEAKKQMPAVLVGSSLGALVALDVARVAPVAPLVLVAPALGFGPRWIERLPAGETVPFFHHGEEKELAIHRRFFEEMARLEVDADPPRVRTTVIMGTRDESVPYEGVARVWKRWDAAGLSEGSRFVAIEDGDHGLIEHVDAIAEAILDSAAGPGRPASRRLTADS